MACFNTFGSSGTIWYLAYHLSSVEADAWMLQCPATPLYHLCPSDPPRAPPKPLPPSPCSDFPALGHIISYGLDSDKSYHDPPYFVVIAWYQDVVMALTSSRCGVHHMQANFITTLKSPLVGQKCWKIRKIPENWRFWVMPQHFSTQPWKAVGGWSKCVTIHLTQVN